MVQPQMLLIIGLSACGVGVRAQQPGQLDPSFGTGGKVITHVGFDAQSAAIATYPNQDFVVAGSNFNFNDIDIVVVRYQQDGTLDNSFGSGGSVTLDLGMGDEAAWSVAIQADGKIVLAGIAGVDPNWDLMLLRLNANGTIDSTFGINGIVLPGGSSKPEYLEAVAIQTDGKIVTAGNLWDPAETNRDFFIARFLNDGTPDSTFSFDGIQTTDYGLGSGFGHDYGRSLAIAGDGKLLVGGTTINGGLQDFVVVRYNSDGSLDNTFGVGGFVTTDFNTNEDLGFSLAINSDAKILLAGSAALNENELAMARYSNDGGPDVAFGLGGQVVTDFGTESGRWSVTLQDTSRIVVAGTVGSAGNPDFVVARYLNSGQLDSSFGVNGIVITDMFTKTDYATAVSIQFSSKVLVAGNSGTVSSGSGISVARFLSHLAVGVPNQVSVLAPTIYPNPAHEFINVSFELAQSEWVSIRLLDLNGRVIQTLPENDVLPAGENSLKLRLRKEMSSGMYLVSIESENGRAAVKFVKD
jgi:uncharacterized delta-60 repeat protein